jgi:hypothetical protein
MSLSKDILALRANDGEITAAAIALAVGCSHVYVARVLRRAAGLEKARPRRLAIKHTIVHLARTTRLWGRQIALEVGCDPRYAELVSSTIRAELRGEVSERGDLSTPKFANNDGHVALVMSGGGFCALSERRGPRGHVVVCLPVTWPGVNP